MLPAAPTSAMDAVLKRAEKRLVNELGSFLIGEPSHRSVSLVRCDGTVIGSSSTDHLGNAEAVARAIASSLPGLSQGDAAIVSDPYSGSAHVQDHWVVVAHRDDSSAALVLVHAHLADVGGQTFGNYYPYARDVWQEGVITTPVRFVRQHEVDNDVMNALKLNSRAPVLLGHDVKLMYDIGREAVEGLSVTTIADEAAQIAAASARVRSLAESVADTAVLSCEIHNCAGPDAQLRITLASNDGVLTIDLTESSDQVDEGFINATLPTTKSAVARAIIEFAAPPANSGVLDGVDIRTRSGTIVDCCPPVAVGWSPFEPGFAIADLVRAGLSRWCDSKVPERIHEPIRPSVRIDGCQQDGCPFRVQLALSQSGRED